MANSTLVGTAPSIQSSHQSLSSEVYTRLRKEIITCRLAPSSRVSEATLSAQLGISRTPIREALKRLAQEGLIRAVPYIGHMIAPFTLGDALEMLDMRKALERDVIERAAGHLSDEQLRSLEAIQEEPELTDEASYHRWYELNTRFHLIIGEACGNSRLFRTYRQLLEEMVRLYFMRFDTPGPHPMRRTGHREMVEALRRGDGATAVALSVAAVNRDIEAHSTVLRGLYDTRWAGPSQGESVEPLEHE